MRMIKSKFKGIAYVLMFLLLFQSCTVYHSNTSSVDQAIASNNKVKVDGSEDFSYKFKKIERINGEIYGLTKTKSNTNKRLRGRETKESQIKNNIYLKLSEEDIQTIHLKNKTASTVVTILVPLAGVAALVMIGYQAANNISVSFGE